MIAPSRQVVDIHAHALSRARELVEGHPDLASAEAEERETFGLESMEANQQLFDESWRQALTDLDTRIAHMDRTGVDVQIVGVSPTQYYPWATMDLATDLVACVNEQLADLVSQTPDRLQGMAHVAFQHPELAAEQLREAVARFGMRSVQISTRSGGNDLSHRDLEPFWATAEELGVLVFIHPWGCSLGTRLSQFYLGNVIGQPLETTVALSHLVFSGVLDRYPALKVCAAHGGGYLPTYLGRADRAYEVRPECRTMAEPPSSYLARIYFDSVVHRPESVRRLVDVCGADRILLGTDYPYDMGEDDPLGLLAAAGLSETEVDMVAGENAVRAMRATGALDPPG